MGRGGNAVVGIRFDVDCEGAWCQTCAYGTAVIVEKLDSTSSASERTGVVPDEDESDVAGTAV